MKKGNDVLSWRLQIPEQVETVLQGTKLSVQMKVTEKRYMRSNGLRHAAELL